MRRPSSPDFTGEGGWTSASRTDPKVRNWRGADLGRRVAQNAVEE